MRNYHEDRVSLNDVMIAYCFKKIELNVDAISRNQLEEAVMRSYETGRKQAESLVETAFEFNMFREEKGLVYSLSEEERELRRKNSSIKCERKMAQRRYREDNIGLGGVMCAYIFKKAELNADAISRNQLEESVMQNYEAGRRITEFVVDMAFKFNEIREEKGLVYLVSQEERANEKNR